ncbi:DUF6069 family protein [Nocardiopsis composta]|uniref:Uncharacterized protein n=1 Tax=Nocardiopsis composta TaxID=157465 RepID=A0A7W8VES7_9ACTN|nr:DUF6069 family protein [Nocardiopsis composta]MBB5433826.1 hypothetical protein [Nocardiopsis composta]
MSAAGTAAERAAGPPAALRRRIRALAAAAAVALPLLLWAAVVPIGGHPLEVSSGMRTGALAPQTMELGAAPFAVVSLLSALLGWALLAVLERFAGRAARWIWGVLAVAVLAVSFLPLTDPALNGATIAVLAAAHLLVGAAVIPAFLLTSPRPGRRAAARAPAG